MKVFIKETSLAGFVFILGFCPQVLAQASVDVCSVYNARSVQAAPHSQVQKSTLDSLMNTMRATRKKRSWPLWQQKLARNISKSHHAQTLLELGFEIKPVNGIPQMISPENHLIPLEAYNHRVLEMIRNGQLQNSEAIFAALIFQSVEQEGELKAFRPGIDELPNTTHWKIHKNKILDHSQWVKFMAEGHLPVDIGDFYGHDLAHVTENLVIDLQTQRPEFMIAVRTIYKEQQKVIETDQHFHSTKLVEFRSFKILENISLGRLDSEAKLRTLRPKLFDNQTSFKALRRNLQRLSFEELEARLKYWIENESQFVLRQGGVERDLRSIEIHSSLDDFSYLLIHLLRKRANDTPMLDHPIRLKLIDLLIIVNDLQSPKIREHLLDYLRNAKLLLDYILHTEELLNRWTTDPDTEPSNLEEFGRSMGPKSFDNIIGQEGIQHLFILRELLNTSKIAMFKEKIADQLARFEMGLVKSVELKITPVQLVYDLVRENVNPDSPSMKWLRSHSNPLEPVYNLFTNE